MAVSNGRSHGTVTSSARQPVPLRLIWHVDLNTYTAISCSMAGACTFYHQNVIPWSGQLGNPGISIWHVDLNTSTRCDCPILARLVRVFVHGRIWSSGTVPKKLIWHVGMNISTRTAHCMAASHSCYHRTVISSAGPPGSSSIWSLNVDLNTSTKTVCSMTTSYSCFHPPLLRRPSNLPS